MAIQVSCSQEGMPLLLYTLANDSALLRCLRRMLCFEPKFIKETCQIISNIAARSRTWIKILALASAIAAACSNAATAEVASSGLICINLINSASIAAFTLSKSAKLLKKGGTAL
ncbi:hypothetical protein POM88_020775 [Heracleum sosnowskyi]|uniref:Uncharacterized protein n=1 Tax=Heracleum sosnowskyi TaxID=360622 RepID=A0AAD8MNE3_9APIA|nr:hypothetical protein POM88_020775 [Heracleum sosnowskyi]